MRHRDRTFILLLLGAVALVGTAGAATTSWVVQPFELHGTPDESGSWTSPVVVPSCSFTRLSCADGPSCRRRLRRVDGGWSDWTRLTSAEPFDDVTEATAFQIRTDDGAARSLVVYAAFRARRRTAPRVLEVVERDQWGAEPPKQPYREQRVDAIVMQHSWGPAHADYGDVGSRAGIQRDHMHDPATGWDDVGYHYLIGPGGWVLRGRPETAVGAHCVPNEGKVGICGIGDHDLDCDPLLPATWRSLERLVLDVANRFDVPPHRLFGHRDFSTKSCPGETVYERFTELRRQFRRIGFAADE